MRTVGAGGSVKLCVCLAVLSGERIGKEAGEPITTALVRGKMAKAGLWAQKIKHEPRTSCMLIMHSATELYPHCLPALF